MKAYIFTDDKMSYGVLERALADNEFNPVELCQPTKERAKAMADVSSDSMILIDFDLPIAAELSVYMPSIATLIAFGSHQAKSKAAATQIKAFVAKPFTREQLAKAIAETLRSEASLPEPGPVSLTAPLLPVNDIRARWLQQLEAIGKRRAELDRLLNATPDQLKVLLTSKVVIGASGNPKVPPHDFPLQTALVVEQDESFNRLITRYLAEKCVMQADAARSGAAAWQLMKGRRYDVIVLQWEVQDPSGLALYNRLRSAPQTRYQPVVVISSTVKTQDFRLLDEDFAVALVPQPVQPKAFAQALTKVVASSVLAKEFIDGLSELVRISIEAEYFAGSKQLTVNDDNSEILFSSFKLGGDRFLAQDQYAAAEAAYATAWKLGDRRLGLLTNYGRACYLGGRSREALKLMATADVLAPKNVERLCMLGEVNLAQKSLGDARNHFHLALAIDPGVKKAQAGLEVAEAMERDPQVQVPETQDGGSPVTTFASYLNLVGINMSRSGNLSDALRYYRAAMTFVYFKEGLAKLWFNVGLCYKRGGKPDLAKEAFQKCFDTSLGTHARAANYLRGADGLVPQVEKPQETTGEDDFPFERF